MLKKVSLLIALYICSSLVGASLVSNTSSALCSPPTGSFGQANQSFQVDPGKYNVWVRMMAPDLTNNSVYMQIDDNICAVKVGDTQIAPLSWVWINHLNGDKAQINQVTIAALSTATPNVHSFKFFGVERGVKIDKVILLPATLVCTPTGDGTDCVNKVDAMAPTVPTGLALGSKTDNSVSLKWNASTDNFGVKGYTIYRNGQAVSTSTTTSFTDTGLTPLTNYTYEVAAFDDAGIASAKSTSVAVQTNASQDTTAPTVSLTEPAPNSTASGTALRLAATASDNVGIKSVDFYINSGLIASDTAAPYVAYSDTTRVADGSYRYTAVAKDLAGNSTTSTPVYVTVDNVPDADTTAPSKVSGLTKTDAAYDHISLSWAAATDNVAVKNYDVLRDGAVVGVVTGTSFVDNLVTSSTTYAYTIRARDTADNVGPASDPLSVAVPAKPDTTAPVVTLKQPTPGTYSGTLSIAADATDDKGVKQVDFYVNGLYLSTEYVAPYTGTYDTKQLPNGSATITAKAYDTSLNTASSVVTITVSNIVPDTTAPTIPTSVIAQAASPYQVNVSWLASTDNVGVVGYNILRDGQKIASTSTLSYGDASLTAATTYKYTVQAYDAAGNTSAQSAVASVTTPPLFSNYVLYGKTTDNVSGNALRSVRVSVASNGVRYTTSSDRAGSYLLSGIPVSSFTAEYSARKYATQAQALTVPSGQSKLLKNVMMNRL